jgi:uncharacterized protein (TIGR02391 family)
MSVEKHKPFDSNTIESISKILGNTADGLTGTEIDRLLQECKIENTDPDITKWKRLFNAFAQKQNKDRYSNAILYFIKQVMIPTKYISNKEQFDFFKIELNKILIFHGYEIKDDGNIRKVNKVETIAEAEKRVSGLKEKLKTRNIHKEIFKYCNEEIVSENYFHLVFEATKSLAQRIREISNLKSDGSTLIDEALSFNFDKQKIPLIAINKLDSPSLQSEQKGFMNLLKGIFSMFRNTTAHEAKIIWQIEEEEAIEILSIISYAHKKLDNIIYVKNY